MKRRLRLIDGLPTEPIDPPDLGQLVIVLLAGTLAGLRDHLAQDGYTEAADVVSILVDITDNYLTGAAR